MDKLKSAGYVYNKKQKIWERPSSPYFSYSDGSLVEKSLYEALKNVSDRSVFSEEIVTLQNDWPSTYHFSFQRANLLRPLEKNFVGARVLELGCGCGGLSRYIGETAKELYGIDGSSSRASIAALRCEDLENTTFIVDRIQNTPECIGKFDIVMVVGVLEYANMFSLEADPSYSLLCKARSFLKEDGFLFLAIENKFGLKYFAGIPEDHTSVPWCSIVDGYYPKGPYTFSRHELSSLLTRAGFLYQEQIVVSPDYKLPASVITPLGLKANVEEFDPVPILGHVQRTYEETPLFNLPQAWRGVYRAGLLLDLADSLCFIAGMQEKKAFVENVFCHHYGALNKSIYCKEVRFVQEKEGTYVRRCFLGKARELNDTLNKGEYFQYIEDEVYFSGKLLIEQMREVCVRNGWRLQEVKDVILPWFLWLKGHMDDHGEISANFIDATPLNVFVQEDGSIIFFDQEWKSRKSLPFIYVVTRGLTNAFIRMGVVAKCSDIDGHINFLFIVENLLRLLGMDCTQEEIFQSCDHPDIIEKIFIKDFEFRKNIQSGKLKVSPNFLSFDENIIYKQNAMLKEEMERANKLEADYLKLKDSFSMRITAPFRYIRKQVATLKQFLG